MYHCRQLKCFLLCYISIARDHGTNGSMVISTWFAFLELHVPISLQPERKLSPEPNITANDPSSRVWEAASLRWARVPERLATLKPTLWQLPLLLAQAQPAKQVKKHRVA